jgi:hypothetical protein
MSYPGVRVSSNMHQNMHQEKRPSEILSQMASKLMFIWNLVEPTVRLELTTC